MNSVEIIKRFTALEAQLKAQAKQSEADRACLTRSENRLRVTWVVSALAAVVMFTMGWHKDAIAQGYGITLAQAATRIAALETKTASMTVITDPNTNAATVRFTGVNVQVVSGSGGTQGTVDGTGNLIVGYNETRASFGLSSGDVRTGSHNLVVGNANNYSSYGGAVIGQVNTISDPFASVSGGSGNTASAVCSSVSGGYDNAAINTSSSVSGGKSNMTSGTYSSVSGGQYVRQTNQYGWAAGGNYSAASPGVGTYHSP